MAVHTGQHSFGSVTGTLPLRQIGSAHRTAAQFNGSVICWHTGQHWFGGVTCIWPFVQVSF